jgi:hypothetical protein
MSYTDLVQMYFERSNALQWLWTLYVVIAGGLLAFSSMRKQRDVATTALVTILFCIFAYKNLGGLKDITMHRFAILEALKGHPAVAADAGAARAAKLVEPTLVPPPWEEGRNTHVVGDVLLVAALWTMELRRRRQAPGTVSQG